MPNPALDHPAQAGTRLRVAADVHDHRVRVRSRPICPGVFIVHDIHLTERLRLEHGRERRRMHVVLGVLLRLDDFRVGQQQRPIVDGYLLAAIEQLGCAQRVRIVAALERIAQDQMAELRQKDRRQIAGTLAGQCHIDGLERRRCDQPVAEGHHESPVLARIGVGERGNVSFFDPPQWIRQQACMQIAFRVAGIGRRHQFRPRQIGHDQFGGRHESAVIGTARQVVTGSDPEFSHVRSVFVRSVVISPRRSTSSAASMSPSTS